MTAVMTNYDKILAVPSGRSVVEASDTHLKVLVNPFSGKVAPSKSPCGTQEVEV